MKAAILAESKQPLVIDDIALPDNLEFGLNHINEALDLFRSGEAGRIIIDML